MYVPREAGHTNLYPSILGGTMEWIGRMRRVWTRLGWWIGLGLLWVLLTDTLTTISLVVGAVVAAMAVEAIEIIRVHSEIRSAPRARWLIRLWHLPADIVSETALLFIALWRQLALRRTVRGSFRAVGFESGEETARWAAWRAFGIFYTSVAPNTYTVDVHMDNDVMLVHQLVRRVPVDTGERE